MMQIDLKQKIRTVPDFPKKGIMFRDITPVLADAAAFRYVIQQFLNYCKGKSINVVASAESRGFIFGSVLAYELGLPFVPLRKPGKLPFKKIRQEFQTEYSTDAFEVHEDAIKPGDKVLIVDDLIATAGTMVAAINLIRKLGGKVIACAVLIELTDLHGREKIENENCELFSIVSFEGE